LRAAQREEGSPHRRARDPGEGWPRLREAAWTIVGIWEDAASVRVEPFEAVELELGHLDLAPAAPPQV
jgi:hypothetical protein